MQVMEKILPNEKDCIFAVANRVVFMGVTAAKQ
jgi:hypothetical protein